MCALFSRSRDPSPFAIEVALFEGVQRKCLELMFGWNEGRSSKEASEVDPILSGSRIDVCSLARTFQMEQDINE